MLVNSPASAARSVPPCLGVVAADTLVPTMVAPVTGVGALGGGLAGATGAQAATSAAPAPSGMQRSNSRRLSMAAHLCTPHTSARHNGTLLVSVAASWLVARVRLLKLVANLVACCILPILQQAVEVTHWSPPSDD